MPPLEAQSFSTGGPAEAWKDGCSRPLGELRHGMRAGGDMMTYSELFFISTHVPSRYAYFTQSSEVTAVRSGAWESSASTLNISLLE